MGRNVTDVGLEKPEGKRELKKHAATIHCSNSLSLLQRKISNALLYHAYKELMMKEEHEITVKQLCRLIGYQGNNHAVIKDALKELISTVIEWNVINDVTGTENWTASSILASVSLEGPLCYYAYSPRMKQLLHSPSMFGKIDLVIQSRFRSSYGLALYENCIRYRGLPHTKWFELDLFKKLMGVPVGMYDIFRDFKLKDRAKKHRLGSSGRRLVNAAMEENDGLKSILKDKFGLSAGQIEQVFSDFESAFIRDKIRLIESSRPYKEGKVQNLAAYLLSALKNNYQVMPARENEIINIHDVKMEIEFAEVRRQIEDLRQRYQQYRESEIERVISELEPDNKLAFMKNFTEFVEPAVNTIMKLQSSKYSRESVYDSPQIKALLRRYALRELDFITLITFDEFAAEQGDDALDALQKLKSFDPEHHLLRLSE